MERAVCIRCGYLKKKTFSPCKRCDLDPKVNDLVMAKSIRLSTRYQSPDGEFLTVSTLEQISKQIESGDSFIFPQNELEMLLHRKHLLDQGLSYRDIAKIILFILVLLLPGSFVLLLLLF